MSKNPQSSFDFGGAVIATEKPVRIERVVQLPKFNTIDMSNVPTMTYDQTVNRISELIKSGNIKRSDKYFRWCLTYEPFIQTVKFSGDVDGLSGEYEVRAVAWSDSAVYLDVFNNGGEHIPIDEFLNRCDAAGAYTKSAWMLTHDKPHMTPSDLIEFYRIRQHIKPYPVGFGTYQECEEIINVLLEWNRNHIPSDEELIADKALDFMRVQRKKGELERTRCMNGECIGSYLISASETSF